MFIMVEKHLCLTLLNSLYYHTPKNFKKLQLSLPNFFCMVTFPKHYNMLNILSNVIKFAIWFQSQHLSKPYMPNHVVEVLENYDHKILRRKITNPHIDLSNEPSTTSPLWSYIWLIAHSNSKSLNFHDNHNKSPQVRCNSKLIEITTHGCVGRVHI
jgi:hypothetical protein